jgi:outer membrane protein assembly factor BamA
MSDKIYCGNAKAIKTQYGEIMKVSLSRSDIEKLTANLNEKGYVNLNITERREADKYGKTHSVVIDTWKP